MKNRRKIKKKQIKAWKNQKVNIRELEKLVKKEQRRKYKAEVKEMPDDRIWIELTGNGFLYNMVRIIAGTLVDVGLGKINPEDIIKIIKSKKRENAGKTLPPQGLYLVKVEYSK